MTAAMNKPYNMLLSEVQICLFHILSVSYIKIWLFTVTMVSTELITSRKSFDKFTRFHFSNNLNRDAFVAGNSSVLMIDSVLYRHTPFHLQRWKTFFRLVHGRVEKYWPIQRKWCSVQVPLVNNLIIKRDACYAKGSQVLSYFRLLFRWKLIISLFAILEYPPLVYTTQVNSAFGARW